MIVKNHFETAPLTNYLCSLRISRFGASTVSPLPGQQPLARNAPRFLSAHRAGTVNWCLNGFASKYPVIANQSADWCGNPPVSGEMYRIAPKKCELLRFLAIIVTWFHGAGGLPHHLSALARNDSKYSTNTNFARCFPRTPAAELP